MFFRCFILLETHNQRNGDALNLKSKRNQCGKISLAINYIHDFQYGKTANCCSHDLENRPNPHICVNVCPYLLKQDRIHAGVGKCLKRGNYVQNSNFMSVA